MHQMKSEDKRMALEELGVSFAKPKHPEFSLLTKRYGSFSEWRYHQSPDSLARAGFYYIGKKKELIKRTLAMKEKIIEFGKIHQKIFILKLWRC